jgi:hypothetical protein
MKKTASSTKKKVKSPKKQPLMSKRIIDQIDRLSARKIIDISEIRKAHQAAEETKKYINSDSELSRLDPLHAVYVFAFDRMNILAGQLMSLPACKKLASVLEEAYDIYMPAFPPISPLTDSYFACWGNLDLEVGPGRESPAKIVIALSRRLSTDKNLLSLYKIMQESRMGLYLHEGFDDTFIKLKELVTETRLKCICPSGYSGSPGEIWFARIFPEPFLGEGFGYSVVFTTPYVIGTSESQFFRSTGSHDSLVAFLARTLDNEDKVASYEKLMKYGLVRHYWNEYIFQAYANHKANVVYLTGIPDRADTRPHFDPNACLL